MLRAVSVLNIFFITLLPLSAHADGKVLLEKGGKAKRVEQSAPALLPQVWQENCQPNCAVVNMNQVNNGAPSSVDQARKLPSPVFEQAGGSGESVVNGTILSPAQLSTDAALPKAKETKVIVEEDSILTDTQSGKSEVPQPTVNIPVGSRHDYRREVVEGLYGK